MSYIESFQAGKISINRARGYALKDLEKNPHLVGKLFPLGIITAQDAIPYAFKVFIYKIGHSDETPAIKNPLTVEAARPLALKWLEDKENNPNYAQVFFKLELLTQEEARVYALQGLELAPSAAAMHFEAGLITIEEARTYAFKSLESHLAERFSAASTVYRQATEFINLGIITKEEAKPYITKSLVKSHFFSIHAITEGAKDGILTQEEAYAYAIKYLNDYRGGDVAYFLNANIITKEEAKTYAFKVLEDKPIEARRFFQQGVLTLEEARPYAYRFLSDRYPFRPIRSTETLDEFLKK